jgi:hypothetical protein
LPQGLSRAETEQEIIESCRIVRDLIGQVFVPFAFLYFGVRDRTGVARGCAGSILSSVSSSTRRVREDEPFVAQRAFGERIVHGHTLGAILRRAWVRRPTWRH